MGQDPGLLVGSLELGAQNFESWGGFGKPITDSACLKIFFDVWLVWSPPDSLCVLQLLLFDPPGQSPPHIKHTGPPLSRKKNKKDVHSKEPGLSSPLGRSSLTVLARERR